MWVTSFTGKNHNLVILPSREIITNEFFIDLPNDCVGIRWSSINRHSLYLSLQHVSIPPKFLASIREGKDGYSQVAGKSCTQSYT